jgi:hypothetical protein
MGEGSWYWWDGCVQMSSTRLMRIGVWEDIGFLVLTCGQPVSFAVFEYGVSCTSTFHCIGAKEAGFFPSLIEGEQEGLVGSEMVTFKHGVVIEHQFDELFHLINNKFGQRSSELCLTLDDGKSWWSDGRLDNSWLFLLRKWGAVGLGWGWAYSPYCCLLLGKF